MASDFAIRHAAHIIQLGGIVAYPTETVYGLGCDIYNREAVAQINHVKQRPLNKQFILLAGDFVQLAPLINIRAEEVSRLSDTEEPTSWVVDASSYAPPWLVNEHNTLTVRITDNPIVKKLCHRLEQPIISTSANLSGKKPATNSLQLHKYFHSKVDKILVTNKNLLQKPSRIIRLCDNHIIRN